MEMLEYFVIAVTVVVVAVPEGIPLVVTLTLAFSTKKTMNNKVLVHHLSACKTMGSATTICSDKTGTLTTNHNAVVKACVGGNISEINSSEKATTMCSKIPYVVVKTLQSIFINNSGEIVIKQDGKREILGATTEAALLEFGLSVGYNFRAGHQDVNLVKVEPFNTAKKRMGVVQLPEGGYRAHCRGASEIVLPACDKFIDSASDVVPLDKATTKHLNGTIENFASETLRILCLAYIDIGNDFSTGEQIPIEGYTCIAIVRIKDPVRQGVKELVAICRSAGIVVRMVTRDNINTAKAIVWNAVFLLKGV